MSIATAAKIDDRAISTFGDESGTEARAVEATLRCLARYGYAKTTVDDIAREAGISRATIYRVIGGKSQLFDRALVAEVARIRDRVRAIAAPNESLESYVVAVVVATTRELLAHEVLNSLMGHEAEAIVSYVAVNGEAFVHAAVDVFAPLFADRVPESQARRLAELLTRISISNMGPAAQWVDLSDPAAAKVLVGGFVLPSILNAGGTK